MPELPEVETIRLKLQEKILNKKIVKIEVLEKKQLIGKVNFVLNQKIDKLERQGKYLALHLTNGYFLNIHLKMTGQILYADNFKKATYKNIIPRTNTSRMPCKFTRIIIYFSDNSCIFFNDLRKFGWIKISPKQEGPKGIDVLAPDFSLEYLQLQVQKSNKPIKTLLLDQDKLAGIGNIYANEILFYAKILPQTKSKTLDASQIKKLFQEIVKTMKLGIKHQGSSGSDEMYVLPDGSPGGHQKYFSVYQREKQPCLVCQNPIRRIKQAGRSSFYCAKCQK